MVSPVRRRQAFTFDINPIFKGSVKNAGYGRSQISTIGSNTACPCG
ncbi:hypothetical protein QUB33_16110 [Microcoleus sp. B3-A4]